MSIYTPDRELSLFPLGRLRLERDALAESLADQLLYRRDPRVVQKDIDAVCWREVGVDWTGALGRLRQLCHDDYEYGTLRALQVCVDKIHAIEERECAELIACHGRVA